jgi:DNA invertase Pin-like site-specific DNA recombinase
MSRVSGIVSGMTAHAIGYCRTSTDHQTHQLQLAALTHCDRIYTETVSGAKRIEDRPELMKALDQLRPGDQLVVWRLDRLSRSLPELLRIVATVNEKGADFASLTENIETRSPGGKLIFHIFGALAEWERDVIRARVRAGMDAYIKEHGSMPGRPSVVTDSKLEVARKMIADGKTINDVCSTVGISRSTLYRHLAATRNPDEEGPAS